MVVSQNLLGTFLGLGKPPHEVVFLKGFLGVHRGTGVLTHSHIKAKGNVNKKQLTSFKDVKETKKHAIYYLFIFLPGPSKGCFLEVGF